MCCTCSLNSLSEFYNQNNILDLFVSDLLRKEKHFMFKKGISYHRRLTRAVLVTLALAAALMGGVGTSLAYEVEDAVAQFNALKHHGEAIGFILDEGKGAPDAEVSKHYQGVVRYPGTGTPVFYLTQLHPTGGFLLVAEMESRKPDGERLRSNLQIKGKDTEGTSPPTNDTYLTHVKFSGLWAHDDGKIAEYKHPGGMAIIDDILFVPLDQPVDEDAGYPVGYIVLFDLGPDKTALNLIKTLPLTHAIDNLAVTTQDNGKYLIWTNGDGGEATKFYQTSSDNLRDPNLALEKIQDWDHSSLADLDIIDILLWPTGGIAHQSSAFVREAEGDLFLVMQRNTDFLAQGLPGTGDDFADLYQVVPKTGGGFKLKRIISKHMYCVFDGSSRICNFGASGTAYVSPSGELILYSVSHDDQDVNFDPDIVRFAEFRHKDVNRPNSPLRRVQAEAGGPYVVNEGASVILNGVGTPPRDRPWVELFDETWFSGRSIVVDYDDRGNFELSDFRDLDGFNDKTSSVRWRAPSGFKFVLWDDKNSPNDDRWVKLIGNGHTLSIGGLEHQQATSGFVLGKDKKTKEEADEGDDADELDFNDKTSSMSFQGSAPTSPTVTLTWNLDQHAGDTTFGETGGAAENGDETGATPTFEANGLDGPSTITVTLKATSGSSATDVADISVLNVPPVVTVDSVTDETGAEVGTGVRLVLTNVWIDVEASFSDLGPDTHTAVIEWGDGDIDDLGAVAQGLGAISGSHVYTTTGAFTIRVEVTDDDGGVGDDTRSITVVDAKEALALTTADLLKLVQDPATDPEAAANIQAAMDSLIGDNGGAAFNGAFDLLEKGNLNAALGKIVDAIIFLEAAEAADSALDLTDAKSLLVIVAKSVAVEAVDEASTMATKRNEIKKVNDAYLLIDEVGNLLAAMSYVDAALKAKAAVRKVSSLLP